MVLLLVLGLGSGQPSKAPGTPPQSPPAYDLKHQPHLEEALELASASVDRGGGPFGALVVRQGEVLGRGANRVVLNRDPSAHAEVLAIREACQNLGTHDLSGCEIYSSCEPCPMCLGAILWARLERVHFAATRHDAARAGFDDALLYGELALESHARQVPLLAHALAQAQLPFERWLSKEDRAPY